MSVLAFVCFKSSNSVKEQHNRCSVINMMDSACYSQALRYNCAHAFTSKVLSGVCKKSAVSANLYTANETSPLEKHCTVFEIDNSTYVLQYDARIC
eukprot:16039-Heterococcus_DN1.PRE.6